MGIPQVYTPFEVPICWVNDKAVNPTYHWRDGICILSLTFQADIDILQKRYGRVYKTLAGRDMYPVLNVSNRY